MSAELQALQEKVDQALERIGRLEKQQGQAVPPWKYLVSRPHAWRRQLEIKGRNITVGQLVTTIRANQLSPEQASDDLGLPLEVIEEALQYARENKALIELEFDEERRRLMEQGCNLEPLPR